MSLDWSKVYANPAVTILTWQWYEDDPVRDLKLYLTDVSADKEHAQWRLE